MNIDFYKVMGWTLALIAAIFGLGLAKPFVRHFYPSAPSLPLRMAAPLIFATLASACLLGYGCEALSITVLVGLALVAFQPLETAKHLNVGRLFSLAKQPPY